MNNYINWRINCFENFNFNQKKWQIYWECFDLTNFCDCRKNMWKAFETFETHSLLISLNFEMTNNCDTNKTQDKHLHPCKSFNLQLRQSGTSWMLNVNLCGNYENDSSKNHEIRQIWSNNYPKIISSFRSALLSRGQVICQTVSTF